MLDLGQIRPGEVFGGRYRVERLLKAGGMGAVYVAEHTATRRRVALKLMRPEIVASPTARERFTHEAQASALIESAHVVDVYDAGVDPETQVPFMVMELLSGKELGELMAERGPLPPAEVVEYLGQAARALDKAHAAGIVHRDLKPDNLFLSFREGEPPRVKILDFGIAKFRSGTGNETRGVAGTPLYMAPEQAKKGVAIGPTTDVWALGLVAYALLVGRPYWEVEDLHTLFAEIFSGRYEPPSARAARAGVALPPAFDAWFFGCVEEDPARRFPHAGDAAARLFEAICVVGTPQAAPRSAQDGLDEAPTRAIPVRALIGSSALAGMSPVSTTQPGQAAPDVAPTEKLRPAGLPPVPAPAAFSASPVAVMQAGASHATAVSSVQPPPPRTGRRLGLAAVGVVVAGALAAGGALIRARGIFEGAPVPVAIALGLSDASCSILAKGVVRCAGDRMERPGNASKPEQIELTGEAVALAVGKHHVCARMADGTVQCWGVNLEGQLGDGTTRSHGPAEVPGLRGVAQVASSLHGGCARLAGGSVKCWGANKYGEIGDGTTQTRLAPVEVAGLAGATSVVLGQDHGCAVFAGGTVRCWGHNKNGQLGDGTMEDRNVPTPVAGLDHVAALSLGGQFSCALLEDHTVRCWGNNAHGELGDGTTSHATPGPVAGLADVVELTTGWRHACARTSSGVVRCWGDNAFGQLGDGTTTPRAVPVPVPGKFTAVAAGRNHTCGVREGKTLCWGRNEEGQLGDGSLTNRLEPAPVRW